MKILINKANIRAFLVLCAKIAASKTTPDRELHFLTALKESVFKIDIPKKNEEDSKENYSDEVLAEYFSKTCEELAEFVGVLSKFLNRNEPFDIIIEGDKRFIHVGYTGGVLGFIGNIRFQSRPDKIINYCLLPKDTDKEVKNDTQLIPAFLDAMEEYRKKRNIEWLQIPLRVCGWCDKPFFGSRYDQRFCCKIHSQRWFAERANSIKRAIADEKAIEPEEKLDRAIAELKASHPGVDFRLEKKDFVPLVTGE